MADSKVSDLTAATPLTTDVVYLVDDPGGSPLSKQATVADLLASGSGFTTYRLYDGMGNPAASTVWSDFWTDTGDALLIVGLQAAEYNVSAAGHVVCSGSAIENRKVVIGNGQEVFSTNSLLIRGDTGTADQRTLWIDQGYFSLTGAVSGLSAGMVFQNPNFQHVHLRLKNTRCIIGTYASGGQAEFNDFRLDMTNCADEGALTLAPMTDGSNYGNPSMRGTTLYATIFGQSGSEPQNAFRCAQSVYHSRVEIHVGAFGVASTGKTTGPTADSYTGANAVFWFDDGSSEAAGSNITHPGTNFFLRAENSHIGANGQVCLWFEDNDSASRPAEYTFIDLSTIFAYDYYAVTDLASADELPRYQFGINQQTQTDAWTSADGTWTSDLRSNLGGATLILE